MSRVLRSSLATNTIIGLVLAFVLFFLSGCSVVTNDFSADASGSAQVEAVTKKDDAAYLPGSADETTATIDGLEDIPEYSGKPYVEIGGNIPGFTKEQKSGRISTEYSNLDSFGRTGAVTALITPETLATDERQSIGMLKPSGWQLIKYDCVDGKYLFNRCHLWGYQNGGSDEIENLITGTRYLNTQGMLPFENEIADYVESTGNSVSFRATPVYSGDELVARGVHMEAYSVEDGGKGVCFNVYCYNVQPDIVINYATGESMLASTGAQSSGESAATSTDEIARDYVLNTNTKRFHYPECSSVDDMKEKNKRQFHGTRTEAIDQGYKSCGGCNP